MDCRTRPLRGAADIYIGGGGLRKTGPRTPDWEIPQSARGFGQTSLVVAPQGAEVPVMPMGGSGLKRPWFSPGCQGIATQWRPGGRKGTGCLRPQIPSLPRVSGERPRSGALAGMGMARSCPKARVASEGSLNADG